MKISLLQSFRLNRLKIKRLKYIYQSNETSNASTTNGILIPKSINWRALAVSYDPFSMSQHLQDKKRIYKPGKSQYALECILWPIGSSLTLFEIWERGADVPLGCLGGQSALPWSAENFHRGRSVSSAQTDEH